ncbi:uncharacterized protein LOC109889472 [Oncorhynchus kisutch]|uniref:uncharacterized protein LOC109889472 n=1 Tax=Oncorhynchus kisutch TaxID=8019 RepID=UPI00099F910A|nr:uncharacterized protein LOC109889472 [Oncorhynchus kisutch]
MNGSQPQSYSPMSLSKAPVQGHLSLTLSSIPKIQILTVVSMAVNALILYPGIILTKSLQGNLFQIPMEALLMLAQPLETIVVLLLRPRLNKSLMSRSRSKCQKLAMPLLYKGLPLPVLPLARMDKWWLPECPKTQPPSPRPFIPFPYPLGNGKTSPSEFYKSAQTGHVPIVQKTSLSRHFSVQGSPSSSDYVSTSKVNPAIQFPKPTSYQPGPRKMSPSVSEQRQQIPIEQETKNVAYKPSSFHNADSSFGSYAAVSISYNAQGEQVPNVQWSSKASHTSYAPNVQKPSHSCTGQGGPYKTGSYVTKDQPPWPINLISQVNKLPVLWSFSF